MASDAVNFSVGTAGWVAAMKILGREKGIIVGNVVSFGLTCVKCVLDDAVEQIVGVNPRQFDGRSVTAEASHGAVGLSRSLDRQADV